MPKRIVGGNWKVSRREFSIGGALAGGTLLAAGLSAAQKAAPTARSPTGPFYPVVRPSDSDADLVWIKGHSERASGQVIQVAGRVFDVRGNPIRHAAIDIWQCNAAGRYRHPNDPAVAPLDPHFQGFARLKTNASGEWQITTIKPAGYDSPIGHRPPHIHFDVRGATDHRVCQLYFPEEEAANAADRLYRALGSDAATSLAVRDSAEPHRYRWDIILAG